MGHFKENEMIPKDEALGSSDPCFVDIDVHVVVNVDGRLGEMKCETRIRIRPRNLFKVTLQIGPSGITPDQEV